MQFTLILTGARMFGVLNDVLPQFVSMFQTRMSSVRSKILSARLLSFAA